MQFLRGDTMTCCKEECKKGDHCWNEGPLIGIIGKRDITQLRTCKHCGLVQRREWREWD